MKNANPVSGAAGEAAGAAANRAAAAGEGASSRTAARGAGRRSPVWRAMLLIVPLLGPAACAKEKAAASTPAAAATKTVADYFNIKVGEKTVRMQLAVRSDEMQRGLMERRDLGRDDGMLFVYEQPQRMSFWMHNTPTPLDIGFFDPAGVLQEVYPMHPFDETTVASRSERLRFALEMNQSWFAQSGVKPGAQLDLQALAAALKARGFEPAKYGLSPATK